MPRGATRLLLAALLLAGCGVRPSPPRSALEATPATLDFGDVRWAVALTKEVRLRNRSERPVLLGTIETDSPAFTIARRPEHDRLAPGEAVSVAVAFQAGHAAVGPVRATLSITSDDPSVRRFEVPVTANVTEAR